MAQAERTPNSKTLMFPAMLAVVLTGMINMETQAQEDSEICPCFSFEEVEAIFLSGDQLSAGGGSSNCSAEDYSVECNAEVIIWDQNFDVVAQAHVTWSDFDPGRCDYIDTRGNPGVERKVTWPHPAPEAIARACFQVIARVIEKSDTSGKCITYP